MSDPYIEQIEKIIENGYTDIYDIADQLGQPFYETCLSINNGILKGYFNLVINE